MPEWIIFQSDNKYIGDSKGVSDSLMDILMRRGIGKDAAPDFFSSEPRTTYDPFIFSDLKPAASELLKACAEGKRICVYGDYDADGVTAAALLTSVLRRFSDNVRYYIPSRFNDGYGLNMNAIDRLKSDGVELIITVDCGSTSLAEIEHAKELGMDIIVTDHHNPGESEPDCLFINPRSRKSKYPFSELCGCGVAFKLAQGITRLCEAAGDRRFTRYELNELLDLVAIATVADVVSLLDENRTLVKYGLMYINDRRRPGLAVLLDALKLSSRKVTSEDVAYIIAPHINALGRMGSADMGVELLMSEGGEERLRKLAQAMLENNAERRDVQDEALKICEESLAKGDSGEFFPVIYAPGAHEGVTGIVAGNLKDELYRPVCVVTPAGGGLLKGTGRSVPGIDLHALLSTCGELFTRFGGHAGACGFTIPEENLPEFRSRMQSEVKKLLDKYSGILTEKLYVEKVLSSEEKSLSFADELAKLEPYGTGNPKPLFCMLGAGVASVYLMGSEQQHMRFTAMTADGIPVECVLFRRAAQFCDIIAKDAFIDVAGELSVNGFRGRRLQMIVKDVRKS